MVKADDRRLTAAEGVGPQIWLALETATAVGSVAVWRDGLAYEASFNIRGGHSERVLPALHRALDTTDTAPQEVSDFVVGSGPGSFTGVRIAASMAKGWTRVRQTSLFAYSSLLALAAGSGARGPVCALFDARRGQVYGACYQMSPDGPIERLAPGAWSIDEILGMMARLEPKPVFAGEGALAYRDIIADVFDGATVLPEHLAVPRAASLLWLRATAPELGRVAKPRDWQPSYVRDWRVSREGEPR